ncbi:MAG: hypothetical protein KDN22_23700 [Verrucomicrobiae bacterium]|nr:hypothetical protein [Verrucomicrobiae bacterium]
MYFFDIEKVFTDRNRSAYLLKLLPRERYILLREPKGNSGSFSDTVHEGEVILSPDDNKAILSLPVNLIEGREFRVWRSATRNSVSIAGIPLPADIPANTGNPKEKKSQVNRYPYIRVKKGVP